MHTQRINLLLTHDSPLSFDALIFPTRSNSNAADVSLSSVRFAQVECRRALELLTQFLRDWCDFAVREKQMYVKFVGHNSASASASGVHLLTRICIRFTYSTCILL